MNFKIFGTTSESSRNFTEAMTNALDNDLLDSMLEVSEMIVSDAKQNLSIHDNVSSSALLNDVGIKEVGDSFVVVGSDLPYAGLVELGRGPVFPKRKKALTWIDKTTGKRVFSKYSGPTEPSPYLDPAVIINVEKFPKLSADRTDATARKFKGLLRLKEL